MRMPRVQVYLPEDLYRALKARGLPASELFQQALRVELERLRLQDELDDYLHELEQEVGDPSAAEQARALELARRLAEGKP